MIGLRKRSGSRKTRRSKKQNKKTSGLKNESGIKKNEKIKKRAVNVFLMSSKPANERIMNSSRRIQLFSSPRDVLEISPQYDEGNMEGVET